MVKIMTTIIAMIVDNNININNDNKQQQQQQ